MKTYFLFCENRLVCSRTSSFYRLNASINFNRSALFTTSANNYVQLKIVKPSNLDELSYEEKNLLLKREQSPHLTIYKPQLTSMMSITHRITGMFSNLHCY